MLLQGKTQRRLAGAFVAADDDERLACFDCGGDGIEGAGVRFRPAHEAWIGRLQKWRRQKCQLLYIWLRPRDRFGQRDHRRLILS
jgi:hypothetical protein